MSEPLFLNYRWDHGTPKGLKKISEPTCGPYYTVVGDPYRKRFSIEKFVNKKFDSIVYDSALFDFRHLKPEHQATWEKIALEESKEEASYLIRDHYGRAIVVEKYTFKEDRCIQCHAYYPDGPLLSQQKMFYQELGDPFNGVILYDRERRSIVRKEYLVENGQFTELLHEDWAPSS